MQAAQRIAAHDGTISAAVNDFVARALGKRPGVEVVVLAEPEGLVVAKSMGVQERPAHQRLQEADLAAPYAAFGNIAFDKTNQIEKARCRRETSDLLVRSRDRCGIDEGDIVGDEIPVIAIDHRVEASREEEI